MSVGMPDCRSHLNMNERVPYRRRRNVSPFRSRETSSPFQIHPRCGSPDHRLVCHNMRKGGSLKPFNPSTLRRFNAFSLLELLIVVGIIGLLLVLTVPAFRYIKGGTDVTSAAYTIKGALDIARTYARSSNTYAWVGFYEEN